MKPKKEFGPELQEIKKFHEMYRYAPMYYPSVASIAKMIGVHEITVWTWLSGKHAPRPKQLAAIREALARIPKPPGGQS